MVSKCISRTFSSMPKLKGIVSVLKLPQLSPTMKTGHIVKWHAKSGDLIPAYKLIFDLSTDSLTEVKVDETKCDILEIELQDEVYFAKTLISTSDSLIECGQPVALFCEEEDDISACQSIQLSDLTKYTFPSALWQAYVKTSKLPSGGCCS